MESGKRSSASWSRAKTDVGLIKLARVGPELVIILRIDMPNRAGDTELAWRELMRRLREE